MTNNTRMNLIALFFGACALAWVLLSAYASAQTCRQTRRAVPAITCVCMSEIGGSPRPPHAAGDPAPTQRELDLSECIAITYALRFRAEARHISLRAHLSRYRQWRRRWIGEIDVNRPERRPHSLHRGLRWLPRARAFRGYRDAVTDALTRMLPTPCDAEAEHWGERSGPFRRVALRRIRAGRWAEVDCGPTRNAFYRVRRHP